eukprot:2257918-Pleurochrysis_carterae.AAC.4
MPSHPVSSSAAGSPVAAGRRRTEAAAAPQLATRDRGPPPPRGLSTEWSSRASAELPHASSAAVPLPAYVDHAPPLTQWLRVCGRAAARGCTGDAARIDPPRHAAYVKLALQPLREARQR